MGPARMLNLRGGSVSPIARPHDTSVIKVDGEVFDRDGYRMDVTVWFRHRNEVLFYLDSGGSVHGPMDQKHSTRLGNISRSGQFVPGSRYYLSDTIARQRSMRRQSDSVAYDVRSESGVRGRTYSESRRPFLSERNQESSTMRFFQQQSHPTHYRTTASHQIYGSTPLPPAHISRWSSLQSTGNQGLWRGSNTNRYATTLTRQHIKKYREPVEMVVKHAPSISTSKVDLVSIDNRRDISPQPPYSPSTFTYTERGQQHTTRRERELHEELSSARRELQTLKRSLSLTGEQNFISPSMTKTNLKSTSTQYLNEGTWTTHTLKKNDGQPCGAPIATTPYRAVSQTNIPGQYSLGQPQWTSDLNIRTTTTYKTAPIQSNYSAHRENMQRKEEQRRLMECEQPHVRHYDDSQRAMGSEVLEEVETITLQPIGRGVHDLEPTGSINRSFRANTPTVSRGFTPGPEISDGYRTIGTSNTHRDHISGAASPFVGVRHGSFLETGGKTSEHRYRATQQSDSHWRATTVPPNYEGSLGGGVHESTDSADWEQALLRRVKDTYREWYLPDKTREEVESLLRDREPGSFLIRNSVSAGRSFSVALKTSVQQPSTSESFRPGPVKHYMVSSVATADGYEAGLQVQGFSGQPIFTDLVSFVHHHCMQPGPFPCVLRLPMELAFHHQRFAHHGTGIKMRPAQAGGGLDVEMFYLGSVQVDKLHSMAAIRKAVTKILSLASTSGKVLSKRCEVIVQARPKHGVQFNGRTKRGKVEELLKANDISFCGMDPEGRTYTDEDLRLRGMIAAKVFGIVVRSKSVWMHGNRVYVFSEVNPNQSALTLVNYVNQLFLP